MKPRDSTDSHETPFQVKREISLTGLTPPLLTQSKGWKILHSPIIELPISKGAGLTGFLSIFLAMD